MLFQCAATCSGLVCVFVSVCMCVVWASYVRVYIYVYMYMYIYIYIYICSYIHWCGTYICMRMCVSVYRHACMYELVHNDQAGSYNATFSSHADVYVFVRE
jgi:hypothetical protein